MLNELRQVLREQDERISEVNDTVLAPFQMPAEQAKPQVDEPEREVQQDEAAPVSLPESTDGIDELAQVESPRSDVGEVDEVAPPGTLGEGVQIPDRPDDARQDAVPEITEASSLGDSGVELNDVQQPSVNQEDAAPEIDEPLHAESDQPVREIEPANEANEPPLPIPDPVPQPEQPVSTEQVEEQPAQQDEFTGEVAPPSLPSESDLPVGEAPRAESQGVEHVEPPVEATDDADAISPIGANQQAENPPPPPIEPSEIPRDESLPIAQPVNLHSEVQPMPLSFQQSKFTNIQPPQFDESTINQMLSSLSSEIGNRIDERVTEFAGSVQSAIMDEMDMRFALAERRF